MATVNAGGLATGASVGSTNISATQSGISSTTLALTVTAATLQSIAMTAVSSSIAKGASDQFAASGTFSDGSTQNLANSVTWNSSNTAVATVSTGGLATGAGAGSTNISASQNGTSSNVLALTVTAATLQSIAITASGTSLAAGANEQLSATGTYSDATTQNLTSSAIWSSSNTAAATISSTGVASAVAVGQTTISATQGSSVGSLALSVTATISGTLSPASSSTGATVTLSGAASGTITVDANGNYSFTGLANGTYTVTPAKSGMTFRPASQSVTISGASSPAINFTATLQTFSISGTLSPAGATAGATVTLSGSSSQQVAADSNSNYSFAGITNGAYTVTPNKNGYVFSPANRQVAVSGSNQTGVNFTTVAGQLSVAPSSFSFGIVNVGTTSPLQTGSLTAASGDVTIVSDALSGAGLILSGITLPLTVTSGQSSSFSVGFAPSLTGSFSGSLSFTSDASNTPSPATLSGTGAGLSIGPSSLNFGSVPDGINSASQIGTLTAVGTNVTVTADTLTGAAFSITGVPAVPFTIAAGQSQQFSVTFSPVSGFPGAVAGSVTFSSSINNVMQTLSGTGTPNVALSWTASTTPTVTYSVYRCSTSASACVQSSPGRFTQIASGVAALTYTDLSVSSGQTHYYALTAVDSTNTESTLSNVISAVIP